MMKTKHLIRTTNAQPDQVQPSTVGLAVVKAVAELVNILLQVPCRYVVVYAVNAPFKYSPATLYRVGVLSVAQRIGHTVVNLYMDVLPVGLAVQNPVT